MNRCGALLIGVVLAVGACTVTGPVNVPSIGGTDIPDEEQVAAVLRDAYRGIEAQRIYKVMAHLATGYRDNQGRTYDDMKKELRDLFARYREIRITRANPRVLVEDDRARTTEVVGFVGTLNQMGVSPLTDRQGRVTADLLKIDGNWVIVRWDFLDL